MSPIHGLRYDNAFLDALPVLQSRPAPHQPIRTLDAAQFAKLHLAHMTSDVNDSVLFPFLHGLEGDNHAQNTFFAGTGGLCREQELRGAVHVPRYRGLLWVAVDDFDDFDSVDDFDCDYDSEPREDHEREDHHMTIDEDHQRDHDHDDNHASHMHPEIARKPIAINTDHDRRPSVSSVSTSNSSESHFGFSTSFSTTSSLPSPASSCPSPCADVAMDDSIPPPATPPSPTLRKRQLPQLTSSFAATDLLTMDMDDSPIFVPPMVPDGISLRNFGIQVPVYATLSDIVIYSRSSDVQSALSDKSRGPLAMAQRFKQAVERKLEERIQRYKNAGIDIKVVGEDVENNEGPRTISPLIPYNVFVLTDSVDLLMAKAPWLMCWPRTPGDMDIDGDLAGTLERKGADQLKLGIVEEDSGPIAPTTSTGDCNPSAGENAKDASDVGTESHVTIPPIIDFAQREREEMRELTRASPVLSDCVWLGNSGDVPVPTHRPRPRRRVVRNSSRNDHAYDSDSDEEDPFDNHDNPGRYDLCIDCRDGAPIPSTAHIRQAESHMATLDALWSARCFAEACETQRAFSPHPTSPGHSSPGTPTSIPPRPARPAPRASHVLHLAFPASPPANSYSLSAMVSFLNFLSGLVNPHQHPPSTRQKRILIYSCDGYTESSVLALCILMKERGLDLPTAYLELQVEKGRSFFVYQPDLAVLKRIEGRLGRDRDMSNLYSRVHFSGSNPSPFSSQHIPKSSPRAVGHTYDPANAEKDKNNWMKTWSGNSSFLHTRASSMSMILPPPFSSSLPSSSSMPSYGSPDSFATHGPFPPTPPPEIVSSHHQQNSQQSVRRPRASTSPLLPHFLDHQAWFNDPRFDGSFPSRVLPFLYLGNLNHASNAYMLHALGITHVVSVGECALVPPANVATDESSSCGYHYVAGKGPGGHGSLWMEEREGRIKVLDIKGVCDDGIDSLQHQLGPVCDWIDKAREEGGKVLVHCRVGVSRSATVTIAYVMKHLGISLVDAYLIVRSRRLSVLIQPNMRLLYNLCSWEVQLARERAGDDEKKLHRELAHSLNWPYLAREVHRLNEKYLS